MAELQRNVTAVRRKTVYGLTFEKLNVNYEERRPIMASLKTKKTRKRKMRTVLQICQLLPRAAGIQRLKLPNASASGQSVTRVIPPMSREFACVSRRQRRNLAFFAPMTFHLSLCC